MLTKPAKADCSFHPGRWLWLVFQVPRSVISPHHPLAMNIWSYFILSHIHLAQHCLVTEYTERFLRKRKIYPSTVLLSILLTDDADEWIKDSLHANMSCTTQLHPLLCTKAYIFPLCFVPYCCVVQYSTSVLAARRNWDVYCLCASTLLSYSLKSDLVMFAGTALQHWEVPNLPAVAPEVQHTVPPLACHALLHVVCVLWFGISLLWPGMVRTH